MRELSFGLTGHAGITFPGGRVFWPFGLLWLFIVAAPGAHAQTERPYSITEEREVCSDHAPLRRPFFGDTHVHTAYSFDASIQDTRNKPRDAYRFARGEEMGIQPYDENGMALRRIQIDRPLDWAVVSDHAELLGEVNVCGTAGTWSYWHPVCLLKRHVPTLAILAFGFKTLVDRERYEGICGEDGERCIAGARDFWDSIQVAAEEAYDRTDSCEFTSFVGYEWTASVGEGQNLHRNVIFRNEKVPSLPVSWVDTPSAVDLWNHLESGCVEGIEGCDAITIPHNSNLSGGLMFETARVSSPEVPGSLGPEEAQRRSRFEPIAEIMQHKGASECDPRAGWSSDEACGFELLPYDRFGGKSGFPGEPILPAANNYVRFALKEGLRHEQALGANPFRYGIIASTDTHIAAPGLTAEKKHPGHGGAGMSSGAGVPTGFPDDIEFNPGGLAVVWAEENTRDALFAAMQRREVYGTSGTRPVVRFFGGWDYPEDLCESEEFVSAGYRGGVAMGGTLSRRNPGQSDSPRFAIWALQDPGDAGVSGTPLQRIQVVKGWLEDGELREVVIDVAGGKNAATVETATCERKGTGATKLCAVWADPDFDSSEPAFYYLRVLENPSCRWSQYLCIESGVDCSQPQSIPEALAACCSPTVPKTVQERAWTSPIWYSP